MPRPFAMLKTEDQWRRAAHEGTSLIGEVVQLAWTEAARTDAPGEPPLPAAGLDFDDFCRLYRSIPEEGQIQRLLWAAGQEAMPLDLFDAPVVQQLGEFHAAEPTLALLEPRGLVVDGDERLYVAETGAGRILVYDLWDRKLLRGIPIPGRPIDLALSSGSVLALVEAPAALFELNARTGPNPVPLPAGSVAPSRIAISTEGELFVLDEGFIRSARHQVIRVNRATDIEFQTEDTLVVARFPGEDLLRFRISASSLDEITPLKARGYDGRGIVRTPDGRIGFWTASGFRHAVAARVRYLTQGRVTAFRLDSGQFNMIWGRLFLDACIPKDTRIHVHCVASDEPPEEATLPRTPPANAVSTVIVRPDLSPPMPPVSLVPDTEEILQELHRRGTGRELPWSPLPEEDPFETYEAPVLTGPGRFLWVTLLLNGNTVFTPRVRSVRAEYPSHDYLGRIPKVFSRDEDAASFLRRYTAIMEGFLGELEGEDGERRSLVDPRSAPAETLPWLAGFVGLVSDERWPEAVRRKLIQEAVWLFRFRGTVPGLKRFLEIYLGRTVIVIEKFRVRGLGGALVGEPSALQANSILGAGFRIGGAVGELGVQALQGTVDDAFETHAHRFAVIIPSTLSVEQRDVVQHILDVHRPAHTLVEVCTVGAGMRVGRGLHIELTSVVGRTGGFRTLQLDSSALGRDAVIGRPAAGYLPGATRLGMDSRVG